MPARIDGTTIWTLTTEKKGFLPPITLPCPSLLSTGSTPFSSMRTLWRRSGLLKIGIAIKPGGCMRREAHMSAALYQSRLNGFCLHGSVSSLAAVSAGWGVRSPWTFLIACTLSLEVRNWKCRHLLKTDCFDWVDSLID